MKSSDPISSPGAEQEQTAEGVVAVWFLRQYEADALMKALNSGATERPKWEAHPGQVAQAIGSAEGVVKALREAGFDV